MGRLVRPTLWWHAIDRWTLSKGALTFAVLASMSGCKGEQAVDAESLELR